MGLKMDVTSDSGIKVKGAYHRIDSISGNQSIIGFNVKSYPSYEAFMENNNLQPLTNEYYSFKPNLLNKEMNIFEQIYKYLKELDNYIGSIDLLEK